MFLGVGSEVLGVGPDVLGSGRAPTTPRMFLGVGPDVLGGLLGGEADNYVERRAMNL